MRRAGHDANLDAAGVRADKVLDNRGVLVALVLQPQRVFAFIDELAEALAAVADAPYEMRSVAAVELRALPVGVVVMFFGSQLSDWTKAIESSMTMDFS